MTDHVLPHDHSARKLLEALFQRSRVIDNEATFLAAGFDIRRKERRSLMRVATHPLAAGYIFKVFFVDERGLERKKTRGWKGFVRRCNQAERIGRVIRENGFQHFKVPRKWLFHTPPHPACDPDDQPIILVAEQQDLLPEEENERAWRHSITQAHLGELHAIIARAGGVSARPDNIALTRQGWFAFIDTEYSHRHHDYESIIPYLSCPMRQYWSDLVRRAAEEDEGTGNHASPPTREPGRHRVGRADRN
jgi:hypothetical protein